MKKRTILGILAVVAVAGAVGSHALSRASSSPSVQVVSGDVVERIVARGSLVPRDGVAKIRSQVDGSVKRVLVREGDTVHAGQLLAEIDAESLSNEVQLRKADREAAAQGALAVSRGAATAERAALQAELKVAEQDATNAAEQAARVAQLHDRGAASEADTSQAAHLAAAARARSEAAAARLQMRSSSPIEEMRGAQSRAAASAAALQQALHEVELTKITAPIEGVVLARRVDPGDTVFAGADGPGLFDLADTSATEVLCELEEADATRLGPRASASIASTSGEVLGHGQVTRVAPTCERRSLAVDPSSVRADGQVRRIWIAWDTPPGAVAIGARLDVTLALPPRRVAALVPRNAVRVHDGFAFVELATRFASEERPVQIGIADAKAVEVQGIRPGERVLLQP